MSQKILSFETRLWRKTIVDPASGCWLWRGRCTRGGYAHMTFRWNGKIETRYVHRLSYEHYVGPIPGECELDHRCKIRNCVNPAHLEPVSRAENIARSDWQPVLNKKKTHCEHGHEFSNENTYLWRGERHCKICRSKPRLCGRCGVPCKTSAYCSKCYRDYRRERKLKRAALLVEALLGAA